MFQYEKLIFIFFSQNPSIISTNTTFPDSLQVAEDKRTSDMSGHSDIRPSSIDICDAMIEAYDVLLALLETETNLLKLSNNSTNTKANEVRSSATSQRKSVERVAKHILSRLERTANQFTCSTTPDSGIDVITKDVPIISSPNHISSGHFQPWEDSSGCSLTAR